MKKEPPDRYDFYLGVIIFLLVIFFIAFCIVNIVGGGENVPEGQLEGIEEEIIYGLRKGQQITQNNLSCL